jgi:hypothetical protein
MGHLRRVGTCALIHLIKLLVVVLKLVLVTLGSLLFLERPERHTCSGSDHLSFLLRFLDISLINSVDNVGFIPNRNQGYEKTVSTRRKRIEFNFPA